MFKFELPATGPLSAPLVRSYLRKQIILIRSHYKDMYFSCTGASLEGILTFPAVYMLIKRSGSNLTTFTILSYIITATNTGTRPTSREKLYKVFKGVIPARTIREIIRYLKQIQFIKQIRYNPSNPTGIDPHLIVLPAGKQYYKDFTSSIDYFMVMHQQEPRPDLPQLNTPPKVNRLTRINHYQKLTPGTPH